jgi:hypothetical protein
MFRNLDLFTSSGEVVENIQIIRQLLVPDSFRIYMKQGCQLLEQNSVK